MKLASLKCSPAQLLPTLMMICLLGTIMVTPLNRAFRFSGSSWRPA